MLTGSHPYDDGAGLDQIVENIENPAKVPTLDPQRHGKGEEDGKGGYQLLSVALDPQRHGEGEEDGRGENQLQSGAANIILLSYVQYRPPAPW